MTVSIGCMAGAHTRVHVYNEIRIVFVTEDIGGRVTIITIGFPPYEVTRALSLRGRPICTRVGW